VSKHTGGRAALLRVYGVSVILSLSQFNNFCGSCQEKNKVREKIKGVEPLRHSQLDTLPANLFPRVQHNQWKTHISRATVVKMATIAASPIATQSAKVGTIFTSFILFLL
jgi:hypothetical protein